MSFPRLLAQVVIVGSQAMARATMEAGRQVLRNAKAKEGAEAAGAMSGQDSVTRAHNMTFDEACNILNVKGMTKEDSEQIDQMLKTYDHLFEVNDPKSGSSFYLQSKVVRAKERIEAELGDIGETFKKADQQQQQSSNTESSTQQQQQQQQPPNSS